MSEAVETTEIVAEEVRPAEPEVKKHEGVFYIPTGSVCILLDIVCMLCNLGLAFISRCLISTLSSL